MDSVYFEHFVNLKGNMLKLFKKFSLKQDASSLNNPCIIIQAIPRRRILSRGYIIFITDIIIF